MSFASGKFSFRFVFLLNYDKRQVMLKLPSEPNEITTIYSAWEGGVCMRVGGGCKVSIVGERQKYKRRWFID